MRRRLAAWWKIGVLVFGALAAGPLSVSAQQTRAQLIDQARNEFDESAAMSLLLAAVSEQAGGVDSLWTVAVHEVAAALLRQGDQTQAGLWLRLAARHGAQWPIDVDGFAPPVVALYRQAIPTGQSVSEVGVADAPTRWQFPGQLDGSAPGRLVVSSLAEGVPLEVLVSGQRQPDAESGLSARAGSYDLTVTSPGYDTARVVREVLPWSDNLASSLTSARAE